MTVLSRDSETHNSTQLIIATLNEEPGIEPTIAEMKNALGDVPILVVDGRSRDRTVEIAKSMGAKVVYQDGIGKGDALAKALEHADLNGGYIVLTDADFTYPANYVPDMIKILEENSLVGMVCGNRLNGIDNTETFSSVIYAGNKLLASIHTIFNGVPLEDPLTGLRVIRAEVLRGWNLKSKGFDIEVELNRLVLRRGFKIQEIPIRYRLRLGEKKLKLRHSLTIIKRIFLEALS